MNAEGYWSEFNVFIVSEDHFLLITFVFEYLGVLCLVWYVLVFMSTVLWSCYPAVKIMPAWSYQPLQSNKMWFVCTNEKGWGWYCRM